MSEEQGEALYVDGQKLESMTQFSFDDKFRQTAILGHLLFDREFFLTAHRRIQPDWFSDPRHHKIYGWFLELYRRSEKFPTVYELLNVSPIQSEDNKEKIACQKEIELAKSWASKIRKDALKGDLTAWLHSKILHDAMVKASKTWNQKKWQNTASILEEATREFRETTFEPAEEISFQNSAEWLEKEEKNEGEALTTGCYLLDKALLKRKENELDDDGLPMPRSKGLQLGDTTVVLAPSNAGKTTTLITMARHNIFSGKSVLFMTHEGRPEDIRSKFFRAMLGMSQEEVFALYKNKDPNATRALLAVEEMLTKSLKYVPYNRAGMKVEDVVPIIRHAQDKRAAGSGKGFDLLVVDYPALLSTERASQGRLDPRHIQDIIYQYYVQLALEYKFHSLLAIQTNREGSKINKGVYDKRDDSDHRLLQMEDVAEAWGPMTSASNVITLNRSPRDAERNRMTYYVAKSRSSETGTAVVVGTKFSASLSHFRGPGSMSTCYTGTHTMEGAIDGHLLNMNGQRIDPKVVYEDSK